MLSHDYFYDFEKANFKRKISACIIVFRTLHYLEFDTPIKNCFFTTAMCAKR